MDAVGVVLAALRAKKRLQEELLRNARSRKRDGIKHGVDKKINTALGASQAFGQAIALVESLNDGQER